MHDHINLDPDTQEIQEPDFGALVISLDFEIHWGVRDHQSPEGGYRQHLLGVRHAVPRMLDVFERYGVAATWAPVGFLFATSRHERERFCPIIRPDYADVALSPYDEPTGDGEGDDSLHYAPSLIADIAKRPGQEIGTHTFSHYYCLEPGQTRAAFEADLESAVAIARARGLYPRSIVFPRNQVNPAYADALHACGIMCYRGTERGWMYHAAATSHERRAYILNARRLDRYLNVSGFNVTAWRDVPQRNGLYNVPASRFLNPWNPRLRHLDALRLRRIVKSLEVAATRKQIFHLWWHPHNFGVYTDQNIAFLDRVLEAFARLRTSHGMRSLTMTDAALIAKDMRHTAHGAATTRYEDGYPLS